MPKATAGKQRFKNQAKTLSRFEAGTRIRLLGAQGVKALRKHLGLTQQEFWAGVLCTQSGGSRYEGGRPMPDPVLALIKARYLGIGIEVFVR